MMQMTPSHDQLLAILSKDHIGRDKAISGDALAAVMGCRARTIRTLVLKLRENAVAVCGRPETGYFIALTWEEVDETCKLLESHALHRLMVAARMRKTSLPELLGQLKLST